MLYVFHVDAGQMTTYDMSLTLQTVANLKIAIERKTKVPANALVLLVSGGEVLESDHMVSSYSAGTDTNPIYMFNKPSVKESHLQQSMCDLSPIVELSSGEFTSDTRNTLDGKSVAELKNEVEVCCSMAPTVHTVITCASLAQQFSDLAYKVYRSCDQLVHEQHLQHQGWAAVVANLEDIYNEFCERSRSFKESFKKHRLKKDEYHENLETLNEVLDYLAKIPILPALQLNAEAHRFSAFDVFEETDFEGHSYRSGHALDHSSESKAVQDFGVDAFKLSEEDVFDQDVSSGSKDVQSQVGKKIESSDEGIMFRTRASESREEPTLLHWILAQGNKASLRDILDYCKKGLALIVAEPLKEKEAELCHILEYANMRGLKQIKGIEDRLYGLDQLLSEVKKLERDQHNQAASLIQYRERLNSACDPSVLPTLVQSHWCQLKKLLKGHQTLVDIRRRISKSKDELSHILRARLEAVLMIENSMSVQDAHAMLSYQCFNRLARYFSIVAQLHRAPAVFVRAVHECARRRTFSTHHLKWATELAEKLLKIHDEEVRRRQEFNELFEGHFLRSLFPGLTDLPPAFSTQAPPVFDDRLPKITDTDVEFILNSFPDLAKDVPQYDMEATVKFFQQRLSAINQEDNNVEVQVDFDKDTDGDNDTGDFERVSQQIDTKKIDISTTCSPDTVAVSTVTEENMDTHKTSMDRLQGFLIKLYGLCKANVLYILEELLALKNELNEQTKYMNEKYVEVLQALERSNEESALRFREQTQRLTVDHELELSDMKASLHEKDDIITQLNNEMENVKREHRKEIERLGKEHDGTKELLEKTREQVKEFERKLEEIDAVKQKEIKELQEKMHMDYKAEIESLRSRFRLVALTNMDRSPSESSLEKIERTDVIEITNHNAIVMQTKENAEVEKEEAVRQAVAKCEDEWKQKLESELGALKAKSDTTSINEATRRLLCEKDRQLELAREREQVLARECSKYRDTIQQLTDPETNDYDELVKTQFASLENEKAILRQEIQDLKKELEKKSEESEKSREDDSEGRSSPRREDLKKLRSRCHTPVGLPAGTLSFSACLPGHTVLVMWEPAHFNYTVMQEAPIMYFVHSDCLPALDLSIQVKNESERKLYAIATVESKEYCYAKKSGNRYHMPRSSRFYRVRVRPSRVHQPHPPCCDHKHKQDAMKGGVLPVFAERRPLKKWSLIPHEQVISATEQLTVMFSNNIGLDESASFSVGKFGNFIRIKTWCEPKDYEEVVNHLYEVLYKAEITKERLLVFAQRLINEGAQFRRNGNTMAYATLRDYVYCEDSNVHWCSVLRQLKFLKQLVEKLNAGGDCAENILNEARRSFRNLTANAWLHLAADFDRYKLSAEPWKRFVRENEITPLEPRLYFDSELLQERSGGFVVGVGGVESCFLTQLSAGPDTHDARTVAPLLVAINYFTQLEGPMWRQIRGSGLSYGYGIRASLNEGRLILSLYRATSVVAAYSKAISILKEFLDGGEFDHDLFTSARSASLFEVVENEKSPADVVGLSLLKYVERVGEQYNKELVSAISCVSAEAVQGAARRWLPALFDLSQSTVCVVCHPSKVNEIQASFEKLDVKLEAFDSIEATHLNK